MSEQQEPYTVDVNDVPKTEVQFDRSVIEPGCGHPDAPITIVAIDIGERREGGDWRFIGRKWEASCDQCGHAVRFSLEIV